eukprot:6199368-Pleurochrysis_carterae.AAC.3
MSQQRVEGVGAVIACEAEKSPKRLTQRNLKSHQEQAETDCEAATAFCHLSTGFRQSGRIRVLGSDCRHREGSVRRNKEQGREPRTGARGEQGREARGEGGRGEGET